MGWRYGKTHWLQWSYRLRNDIKPWVISDKYEKLSPKIKWLAGLYRTAYWDYRFPKGIQQR